MNSMRLIHASLEQSKAVGLNVELCLSPDDWGYRLDALQTVDAALAHIDRWEH